MITQENKDFLLNTFNINTDEYSNEELDSMLDRILSSIYNELEENKKTLDELTKELSNAYKTYSD